jgi:drug/metabolite transporter (DMT)-like permease
MSRHHAIALVLLSALGFGSMALFTKLAYAEGVSPTMLLSLRFLLAAGLLAPLIRLRRLRLPRGGALAGFALMGALYTAQSQSYFTALLHASSGLVGLLLYIYPVLVSLLSLLLGWDKLDRRTVLSLALAIAGIAITLGGDLQGQPIGIALGVLAAAIYAVYILLGSRLSQGTDPLAATFVIMAAAALGNTTLALTGGHAMPASATAWLAIGAIALFSTVIAIAAFLIGIKYIGASQASIISTLEPVITICLGVGFLGESVTAGQLAGGAMVLAAVILLAQRGATTQASSKACQAG